MQRDDWTPEERAELRDLHRDWHGESDLENRIVGSLRSEGLIRGSTRLVPWRRAYLLAASVVFLCLMTASYLTGHHVGSKEIVAARQTSGELETLEAIPVFERASAQYLDALHDLTAYGNAAASDDWRQSRQVALNALHRAAGEMIRMAPDDPVSSYLIQAFDRLEDGGQSARPSSTWVAWF